MLGKTLPAAGGAYFRILNPQIVHAALRSSAAREAPGTFHIHPWEWDPGQPVLDVPVLTKIRHYGGQREVYSRLQRLFGAFKFGSIASILSSETDVSSPLRAAGERSTSSGSRSGTDVGRDLPLADLPRRHTPTSSATASNAIGNLESRLHSSAALPAPRHLSLVSIEGDAHHVLRDAPATRVEAHPHSREGARRALNVAVAAVRIIVTLPIMILAAVSVKLSSPGPILYRQKRVGLDKRRTKGEGNGRAVDLGGRPFTMFKFRTMRVTQEGQDPQVWTTQGDPRITPVGQFLRRTHLDEIPQLFNVILGDMNVVGPRPEQPAIFQNLQVEVPNNRARQQVRPGITGKAQITLEYDSCIADVRSTAGAILCANASSSPDGVADRPRIRASWIR